MLPGTAIEGISEIAINPTAARSGIRAVSTTWSITIVSSPMAATMKNDRAVVGARGAEPCWISTNASLMSCGTSRTLSGVGRTASSAVSRRKKSVTRTSQTTASTRLTATAGMRNQRAR